MKTRQKLIMTLALSVAIIGLAAATWYTAPPTQAQGQGDEQPEPPVHR